MKTRFIPPLAALIAFGLLWAQDGGTPNLQLSEVETLRGRVVALEIARLEDRIIRCLPEPNRPLAEQVNALNKSLEGWHKQLNALGEKVLKDHQLNPAEYAVNWKEGRIEPRKPL